MARVGWEKLERLYGHASENLCRKQSTESTAKKPLQTDHIDLILYLQCLDSCGKSRQSAGALGELGGERQVKIVASGVL